jgi:hypothetical protein
MTIDTETNPDPEAAELLASDEGEGVDGALEDDAPEPELDDDGNPIPDDAEAATEETEEVEHEGKKYAIPKAVKPLLMFQQDYTKKTQDVADLRRTVETQAQDLTQRQQAFAQATQQHTEAQEKLVTARAELVSLDQNIAAYDHLIQQAEAQQDYETARRYRDLRGDLKDERSVKQAETAKHQGELAELQTQALSQINATRQAELEKGVEVLAKDPAVKLSKPVFDAVASHLQTQFGIQPTELYQTLNDPRVFKVAKAFTDVFAENSKLRTENASLKKSGATSAARPAETVRGRSPAGKDPDKLTTADWWKLEDEKEAAKLPRRANGQFGRR